MRQSMSSSGMLRVPVSSKKNHPQNFFSQHSAIHSSDSSTAFLYFSSNETERKFELNNLLAKKSLWNILFIVCIPSYILAVYWSNIIFVAYSPLTLGLCIVTVLAFVGSTFLSTVLQCRLDAETIVHSPYIRRLFAAVGFIHLACYMTVYVLHGHHNLCHPMSQLYGHCHNEEYPFDILFCLIFVTTTIQQAFPSFSWGYALTIHSIACVVAFVCIPLFDSYQQIPVIILGTLSLTGNLFIDRREAIGYFRLLMKIENQQELEQQAKLGDRLRVMISGVAHDLKSPLSALSLGLESIPSIYESIRSVLFFEMPLAERQKRSEVILQTIQDLGFGMDHSRHAMATIIGRCVDINQALNGIPLIPALRQVDIATTINSIVNNYGSENHQVNIDLSMEETLGMIETDLFWLQESLSCLLSNAIKFCDYSSQVDDVTQAIVPQNIDVVVGKVMNSSLSSSRKSLSLVDGNDYFLRVEVWDEGIGVDDTMESALFTFLGHSQQVRVGGAGLGLGSLACRVRTLGGNYGYISRKSVDIVPDKSRATRGRPTVGSIFWFEIPYTVNDELREQWMSMGHHNTDPTRINKSKTMETTIQDAVDAKSLPLIPIAVDNTGLSKSVNRIRKPSIFSSIVAQNRISPDAMTIPPTINSTEATPITSPRAADGFKTIQKRSQELRSQLMGEKTPLSVSVLASSSINSFNNTTPRESIANNSSSMESRKTHMTIEPESTIPSHIFPISAAPTPRHNVLGMTPRNKKPSPTATTFLGMSSNVRSAIINENVSNLSATNWSMQSTLEREHQHPPSFSESIITMRETFSNAENISMAMYDVPTDQALLTAPPGENESSITFSSVMGENIRRPIGLSLCIDMPSDSNSAVIEEKEPKEISSVQLLPVISPSGKCILVVDDSMPIRKMCSMILKQHGHTVMTAMNGKEALQMMVQSFDARLTIGTNNNSDNDTLDDDKVANNSKLPEIDLVLMDIQMPVMDGIEAVTLYRAHETQQLQELSSTELSHFSRPQRLLIIGMSACSDVAIVEKGMTAGMDHFVAKPFQIQQLTPLLNEKSTWNG